MFEQRDVSAGGLDLETQVDIVKEIKNNIASLKESIDQILDDVTGIRNAKLEILYRFDCVKSESAASSAQIQATLGKVKRVMRKSEENRRKLEIVLKKINDFNFEHTFTNVAHPTDTINGNTDKGGENDHVKDKSAQLNINCAQERFRLHLLDNNKYMLTNADQSYDELGKEKPDFKWGKDSALKELQWIVKMKLYKLRHHYDRLPYDQDLEEQMPLSGGGRSVNSLQQMGDQLC